MSRPCQHAVRPRFLRVLGAFSGASALVVAGALGPLGAGGLQSATAIEPTEPAVPTATPSPTPTTTPPPAPIPASAPIRLVQANLRAGMNVTQTNKDLATIYATRPDFVTLNEVNGRPDAQLAPVGYGIQRTPGTYTGATPVLWNTERWTALGQGTYNISNVPGKTATQKVEWGIRYANWVTVQSSAGQVVSVISTHFAPKSKFTNGLTVPSLRRLGALAATLNQRGPVLIGGDLNVNYRSAIEYPRAEMAAQGLTPTYDVMGQSLPTGDYKGATIDYLLLRSAAQFTVQRQWITELKSDHKMLAADVALLGASASYFAPGTVVNDPAARARVIRLATTVLAKAPKGANVRILSRSLTGKAMYKAIRKARARGVRVAVIVGNRKLSGSDRRLKRMLGTKTSRHSYFTQRPKYWKNRKALAKSVVTASASGGTTALRVDINRPLRSDSRSKRTVARISNVKVSYDWFFKRFEKMRRR